MTKRHATPTPAQLANRTYRKVLSLESEQRSAYRMLMERMETTRASLVTLTDHCARLLREKETLVRMLEKNGIVWAHVSMDKPTISINDCSTIGQYTVTYRDTP